MNTTTADLGAQIAEQREKLADTVTALAGKIDANELRALADKIDTSELRARAESGAAELLDNVTDSEGNPKRGVLLGALAVVGVLVLVRKLVR